LVKAGVKDVPRVGLRQVAAVQLFVARGDRSAFSNSLADGRAGVVK
jgi:hypothetical protein